jgi:FKBP-type peptidyl-prolyl cis-trans isomerase
MISFSHQIIHLGQVAFLIFAMSFMACKNETQPDGQTKPAINKDKLVKVNKNLVRSEDQQIEDFILRYRWDMQTTGTGLRQMIYKHGTGSAVMQGDTVTIRFSVGFLNGETCYSSDNEGLKTFIAGNGAVERGLDEGILLMKKGDHAKFILPSHLAFGLAGDGRKIPAKATLVYDIELIEIK